MIVFEKIWYKNLLSTGNVPIEIRLDSHRNTFIGGRNGSGKSSFLDAIVFALYGKSFRKINKPSVINSINQRDCVVSIEFSIGIRKYRIVRGIKPNIFEIYIDGKLLKQNANVIDYQDYLEKQILKISYKVFTQIVILGSSSYVSFMDLNPVDRRVVIENLLDLQIFGFMSQICKSKFLENRDKLSSNVIRIQSERSNAESLQKTLDMLQENTEIKLFTLKEKLQSFINQGEDLQKEIEEKENEMELLFESIPDSSSLSKKHVSLVSFKSKIENNKARLHKELEFYSNNDVCPTCHQSIENDFKETKLIENRSKFSELQDGLEKITLQIETCMEEIDKFKNISENISNIKLKLSNKKVSYENVNRNIASISREIEEISSSDKSISETERMLQQSQYSLSELEKEKKIFLNERNYIDAGMYILKDGGIKTKIINQYIPIINNSINKYLKEMGMFVSFTLNDQFEETIKSRYHDIFGYNNFSEGEKFRINLALILAWRDIAKMRNSVHTSLLIFDEILEKTDQDGVDAFLKIMYNIDSKINVYVISHKENLEDKFERTLKFEKVRNFSQLIVKDSI